MLSNEIRKCKAEQILIRIPDTDMSDAISLMEKNKGIFFRFIFADSATISFNN